ncbi:MAG: hypothetical protein ACOCYG_00310 [Spirochaetota bacterium]
MKKAALFIVVMLSVAFWTHGVELGDREYEVLSEREEEGFTLFEVRSPQGNRLTVGRAGDTFSDEELNNLDTVRQTFFEFETIRFEELKVLFYEDQAEILLVPSRISYDDRDLLQYVPSGMQFYLRESLQYDFRMVVEEFFVRVRGEFLSEEQLLNRMSEAAANPVSFVQSTDPRYLFEQLNEIRDNIDEAERVALNTAEEIRVELSGRVEEGQRQIRESRRAHRELENALIELAESHEELQTAHQELQSAHDDLLGRHEALREQHIALEQEFLNARYGVLVLNNRGWFGRIDLPDPTMVTELVAMKEDNPDLTVDEATDLMQERFPEADVDKNEIFLVFVMYFNETE